MVDPNQGMNALVPAKNPQVDQLNDGKGLRIEVP
jgi:hypothetical protein